MENKDKSAFPLSMEQIQSHEQHIYFDAGLTKREYFAGLAMQGVLSSNYIQSGSFDRSDKKEDVARLSIKIADELLKQLETNPH